MGFPVPLNSWASKIFGGYAYEILTSSKSRTKELFNISFIEKFMKKNLITQKKTWTVKKFGCYLILNCGYKRRNYNLK